MPPRQITQRVLFDDAESPPLPRLQNERQAELLQQMTRWMQAVAVAINEEFQAAVPAGEINLSHAATAGNPNPAPSNFVV